MNDYNTFSLFKEATFTLIGLENAKSVLDLGQGEAGCVKAAGFHMGHILCALALWDLQIFPLKFLPMQA